MKIDIQKNGGDCVIKLEGRLDTTTSPSLDKVICDELDGVTDLIIDMSNLAYTSSAGLRVLLSAQKKMNAVGTMKLVGVCEEIMEVFEITGFADILNIE